MKIFLKLARLFRMFLILSFYALYSYAIGHLTRRHETE